MKYEIKETTNNINTRQASLNGYRQSTCKERSNKSDIELFEKTRVINSYMVSVHYITENKDKRKHKRTK